MIKKFDESDMLETSSTNEIYKLADLHTSRQLHL